MDLVPLEGIKMEEVESVTFNVSVKVLAEGENATVAIPPEITPTERLVSYLYQVLKARNQHYAVDTKRKPTKSIGGPIECRGGTPNRRSRRLI